MTELQDRVAIVTGSSSGVGEHIAQRMSSLAATVVVNSPSSVEAGQAVSRDEDLAAAFRAHPAIGDAVLLDADVESSGQKVVAVWSWAEGHTATVAAVLAFVRSRTSAYTALGSVIVVNALPRTTADTVDDMVIRQIVSVARLLRT